MNQIDHKCSFARSDASQGKFVTKKTACACTCAFVSVCVITQPGFDRID